MGDRWMDERDRQWRERDWRRAESYGRAGEDRDRSGAGRRFGEDRTWAEDERGGPDQEAGRRRPGVFEPGYGGRSSVATGGGAYGYGGSDDHGYARSYRADRDREARAWRDDDGRSYDRERERGYAEDLRRPSAGATSGYGYDRGYPETAHSEPAGGERWEERREGTGDFLHRAGERISSWFRGDHLMQGSREEADYDPRHHAADSRYVAEGHRGRGPKGYQRSDARISDEVHDRLTDDPWLDASRIEVEVKGGEVTLSGHVENREAKHRAERLIEDLSGVGHVQNNLRVDAGAGFTGAGRGYGSSALEAEMRRHAYEASPDNRGASGVSGRTSTGAAAEQSTGPGSERPADPPTGARRN